MTKIGLYDPNSLTAEGDKMKITFVDAIDVTKSMDVEIGSSAMARKIIGYLARQESAVDCPLHVLGEDPKRLAGVMMMSSSAADEGVLMANDDGQTRIYSVKTLFDLNEGDIPKEGIAVVKGFMENDTMMAHTLLMQPAAASLDHTPTTSKGPSA